MTRTILLAATLLIATGGCNKTDETVVNDPMAANDVVDLPGGEGTAEADGDAAGNAAAPADAANAADAMAGSAGNDSSAANAVGNAAGNGY